MSMLDELIAKIENTDDFNRCAQAFLDSQKQLIDTLVASKNKTALLELLENDWQNQANLREKLLASGTLIANLNKIENYTEN